MFRVAGVKNNRIQVISNTPIDPSCSFDSLIIPDTLNAVSDLDLMMSYRVKDRQIIQHKGPQDKTQCRVAFITNYKQACGISTYSEHLIPEIIPHIKEFKLFVEQVDQPTSPLTQLDTHTLTDAQVSMCWKRGEPLTQLVQEVKEFDPDVVLISHEYGIFPNARYWLSLLTQLSDYRVIVILHSVFPQHQDKSICEAAIPEIIVHSAEAKTALQHDKHIKAPIHIIPHGCYPAIDTKKLWNLYRSPHTFILNGFGFRYKGMGTAITAAALLKDKYPDVFLTILFSESPHNKAGHQAYYQELTSLIDKLGVSDHIAIVRGYQSDQVLDAYLRTNQVAVFPYQSESGHLVYGSSGAIRLAASKGLPVISSDIPHFSDFPSIKTHNAQELADALDTLFADPLAQQKQVEKQLQFIKDNSWQKVAQQVIDLFERGLDNGDQ